MKTFIPTRPRPVVSLFSCIALILTVQTAHAASTNIIHSPTPHTLYSNSAIEPESLPYPTTAAAAVVPVIHKSPYPADSFFITFCRSPRNGYKAVEEKSRAVEEAAKKKAEEEEAKKKAEEEEAARRATEKEVRKKAEEEEAARKAAEEAEAARGAKEEADRKAAVEESDCKAKEEAEKNKDKDKEHNEGTAHDKDNEQELEGDKDNGTPDPFKDGTTTKGNSTERSKSTIMIAAIAGSAALVAIVVTGFMMRHKRDVTRRTSAMEAYLSKKVELRPMGNDNDDTSTSFSHNNSNNGGNSGRTVYSHRNNSRHERSQQHLAHPSPRHQHVNQYVNKHYDNHHYDDNDHTLPSIPTLMTTAAGIEASERYYPQYHYEDYHAFSPVMVQSNLAPQDQYEKYCQQQGHDYYTRPQKPYDEYYDQTMYSTSIATETTIDPISHPSPTFVEFPFPPAVALPSAHVAIDTSSKELSSAAAAPTPAADSVSASLASPLPRDPNSLTCSGSTASSFTSISRNSTSAAVAGMKSAKGSFKRSSVEALIASDTSEGANDERSLRSDSVLFE